MRRARYQCEWLRAFQCNLMYNNPALYYFWLIFSFSKQDVKCTFNTAGQTSTGVPSESAALLPKSSGWLPAAPKASGLPVSSSVAKDLVIPGAKFISSESVKCSAANGKTSSASPSGDGWEEDSVGVSVEENPVLDDGYTGDDDDFFNCSTTSNKSEEPLLEKSLLNKSHEFDDDFNDMDEEGLDDWLVEQEKKAALVTNFGRSPSKTLLSPNTKKGSVVRSLSLESSTVTANGLQQQEAARLNRNASNPSCGKSLSSRPVLPPTSNKRKMAVVYDDEEEDCEEEQSNSVTETKEQRYKRILANNRRMSSSKNRKSKLRKNSLFA